MALQYLDLRDTHVSDLGPLAGMKLTSLSVRDCPVTSLRGLENMPLTHLCCLGAPVKDLGPLKGMLLKELHIGSTKVTDLTPLAGMNLQVFSFTPKNITKGVDIVRGMKSIRSIRFDTRYHIDPEEFWKKYDAGEYDQ